MFRRFVCYVRNFCFVIGMLWICIGFHGINGDMQAIPEGELEIKENDTDSTQFFSCMDGKENISDVNLFPLEDNTQNTDFIAASTCSYTGATKYDESMTKAKNYKFKGKDGEIHYAVYFRVDGQANCYRKISTYPTCCGDCGNGTIPYWHLFCKTEGCPWYLWNGKYVKDVMMLIPGDWWWSYYRYWPMITADTIASSFTLYWLNYDNPAGCCDPGCSNPK